MAKICITGVGPNWRSRAVLILKHAGHTIVCLPQEAELILLSITEPGKIREAIEPTPAADRRKVLVLLTFQVNEKEKRDGQEAGVRSVLLRPTDLQAIAKLADYAETK